MNFRLYMMAALFCLLGAAGCDLPVASSDSQPTSRTAFLDDADDEEEVYGNIYVNGARDTSSLYYGNTRDI